MHSLNNSLKEQSSEQVTQSQQKPNQPHQLNAIPHDETLVYQIEQNLYINLTDRCTLACQFCPKHNGCTEVKGYDLAIEVRPPAQQIIDLIGNPKDYESIVFCGYGEPTLRLKPMLEIAHWVKSQGGKTRLNTDGLGSLVNKRNILPELSECIDALSISLNAQNEAVYIRHCQPVLKGSYEAMLEFVALAPEYISDVSASAINGLEGVDIDACKELAEARGVKFKQRELDIVG
ncbi:TatD family nuclease-associated radical SAM protein [Amphritea japonica]|uniref:Radical SAM domain-containing protein n=1 Tax=Amphritea japonica ATCC BAA-1530 TaxID=1278309 RepID=A0A7R6SS46_9GAMM|nr:TatD family nuclease-associated radical SAM protein [Amphritea japonica]BBB25840.1 radical SAM domain-containing protein [Amphritea japonica ATCC BAA-1530]